MASLGALDRRLRRVGVRLEDAISEVVAEVGAEIGKVLVIATPVDTGLARGNWRPSLNVAVSRPTSLVDPTGTATIARIASVARQYRAGNTLFISNRVPYIGKLNAGSSPQAPAGFVQASVRLATRRSLARRRGLSTAGGGFSRSARFSSGGEGD